MTETEITIAFVFIGAPLLIIAICAYANYKADKWTK